MGYTALPYAAAMNGVVTAILDTWASFAISKQKQTERVSKITLEWIVNSGANAGIYL